jgi:hypothetical protein
MSALKTWVVNSIVFSTFLIIEAQAQVQEAQGPSTNGCGSGWSLAFVPNRVHLANCQFEESCNSHDRCYGQCNPGGALFGTPSCNYLKCRRGGLWYRTSQCDGKAISLLDTAAGNRRLMCDRQLGIDIVRSNPKKPVCEALGWVYQEAVSLLGNPNFSGLGNDDDKQSKIEYEQELKKFLAKATEQELQDFSRAKSAGSSLVDLTKPIIYQPGKGIVNRTNKAGKTP